jgi:hypothetical protein
MKLRDKSRFRAAFAALYGIVYIQGQGTVEERADAVANHIQRFKHAFSSQGPLLECFIVHWEGKSGDHERLLGQVPLLAHTSLGDFGPTIMCLCADLWDTCLRQHVNHCGDHTRAICEHWHSPVKRVLREEWGEHLRVDRVINHSLTFVTDEITCRRVCESDGVVPFFT